MPFYIQTRNSILQDLGTKFNVNAYDDEAAVKTTLLEGSVRVLSGSSAVVLKPGEQAVVRMYNAPIKVMQNQCRR